MAVGLSPTLDNMFVQGEPLKKYEFLQGWAPTKHTQSNNIILNNNILSRVGDRPTTTILHAQFHFLDFCFGFYNKIFDQNMPLREGINI